jgi:DNA-binding MarR family transcriptional regulator
MTPEAKNLYALIRSLRTGFNRLKAIADDMHRDLGTNASMRAVMEAIVDNGEQTVPEIARPKGVSRQHIQVNVDALLQAGLVTQRENPAHKRSPLIDLTAEGRRTFRKIQRREAKLLENLAADLPSGAVNTAAETLATLNELLSQLQPKGNDDA